MNRFNDAPGPDVPVNARVTARRTMFGQGFPLGIGLPASGSSVGAVPIWAALAPAPARRRSSASATPAGRDQRQRRRSVITRRSASSPIPPSSDPSLMNPPQVPAGLAPRATSPSAPASRAASASATFVTGDTTRQC